MHVHVCPCVDNGTLHAYKVPAVACVAGSTQPYLVLQLDAGMPFLDFYAAAWCAVISTCGW
jgi:hypothetical protein